MRIAPEVMKQLDAIAAHTESTRGEVVSRLIAEKFKRTPKAAQ